MTKEESEIEMSKIRDEFQMIADGHPDFRLELHVLYRFEGKRYPFLKSETIVPDKDGEEGKEKRKGR